MCLLTSDTKRYRARGNDRQGGILMVVNEAPDSIADTIGVPTVVVVANAEVFGVL